MTNYNTPIKRFALYNGEEFRVIAIIGDMATLMVHNPLRALVGKTVPVSDLGEYYFKDSEGNLVTHTADGYKMS